MISADAIRGHIDLIVLSLLASAPSYAYELARTISVTAEGQYMIKQTTLYSALKRLEEAGLVASYADTSESGKQRTYYRLTPAGDAHLHLKLEEWQDTRALIDRFATRPHLTTPHPTQHPTTETGAH